MKYIGDKEQEKITKEQFLIVARVVLGLFNLVWAISTVLVFYHLVAPESWRFLEYWQIAGLGVIMIYTVVFTYNRRYLFRHIDRIERNVLAKANTIVKQVESEAQGRKPNGEINWQVVRKTATETKVKKA